MHQICQPSRLLELGWVCPREAEPNEADNEVADAKPLKNARHSKFAEGDPARGVEDEPEEKELIDWLSTETMHFNSSAAGLAKAC